jgi:hypothetical protein
MAGLPRRQPATRRAISMAGSSETGAEKALSSEHWAYPQTALVRHGIAMHDPDRLQLVNRLREV